MPEVGKLLQCMEKRFGGRWIFALRNHPRHVGQLCVPPESDMSVDVTDYPDIQELLAASDVVLTDYSSAIFDFVLTKKPGFMLVEDYEEYRDLRGLYYPPEESPFPVAYSQQELLENIERFDEQKYLEKADLFMRRMESVEDGKAAERVVSLIKGIVEDK